MIDVAILDRADVAVAALEPTRLAILRALAEPGSATTVAAQLGLARQKVNYHLRELERHGLVELVELRPRRGLTERVVVAAASGFVVSPGVLGEGAVDPAHVDRLSSRYLVAVAARLLREVAELAQRADEARQPLATLTIDTDIRFASAAQRSAFTEELAATVAGLAATYHDESAPGGRWHRLVLASHPRPGRTRGPHTKEIE